jgi:DNA-binding CsgD family transcriptional regulator
VQNPGVEAGGQKLVAPVTTGRAGSGASARMRAVVFDPQKSSCDHDLSTLDLEGVEVVGHATSVRGALSLLGRLRPEMLVTAGGIPTQGESWTFFSRAAGVDPSLTSVVVTGEGEGTLQSALIAATSTRHDHPAGLEPRPILTRREREILTLAAPGRSNAAIARILWVTADTVKFHLANSYRKLGVHKKADAVEAAEDRGLI